MRAHSFAPALLVAALACSSTPTDVEAPVTGEDGEGPSRPAGNAPDVDADVGALNETQVMKTFASAQNDLSACLRQGASSVPYVGGHVRFYVRVNKQGEVARAHLEDSSIGHRDTEACMLAALKKRSWPAPQGGREGIAQTEFSFDPPNPGRPPIEWSASDVGKNRAKVEEAIAGCKRQSGSSALQVTAYVEADGTIAAAGVSGDEGAEAAAGCVVSALRDIKLDSPGSWAAKVTFR